MKLMLTESSIFPFQFPLPLKNVSSASTSPVYRVQVMGWDVR